MATPKFDPLLQVAASPEWQDPAIQRWWASEIDDNSNNNFPYRCLEKTPAGPMIRHYDIDLNCCEIHSADPLTMVDAKKAFKKPIRTTTRDFIRQLISEEKDKGYTSTFLYQDVLHQLIATEPVLAANFVELNNIISRAYKKGTERWRALLNVAEYGWNLHTVPNKELVPTTAPAFKVHTLWMTLHQLGWESNIKNGEIEAPLMVAPIGYESPRHYVLALKDSVKTYLVKMVDGTPEIQLDVQRETPSAVQAILKNQDNEQYGLVFGASNTEGLAKDVSVWNEYYKGNRPKLLEDEKLSSFLASLISANNNLDTDLVTSIWQWFEKEYPEKASLISGLNSKPLDCVRMIPVFAQINVVVAPMSLPSEFEDTP